MARAAIRKSTRCNDKRLRLGPAATCTIALAPACAGTLATDAVALAYGPNNPPAAAAKALTDQRRCQKQVGKGVVGLVNKLVGVTRGRPAAEAERIVLDARLGPEVAAALADLAPIAAIAPPVYPLAFACPSGVLHEPATGRGQGAAEEQHRQRQQRCGEIAFRHSGGGDCAWASFSAGAAPAPVPGPARMDR